MKYSYIKFLERERLRERKEYLEHEKNVRNVQD